MKVNLAYGKKGLALNLNDDWNVTIIEPRFVPGLPDANSALRTALRTPIESQPLAEVVPNDARVGIIFNDITRPTPNKLIISAILEELVSVPTEHITLFNALGTHRPNSDVELRGMLGDRLMTEMRIVQNNAFDCSTQAYLGTTSRGHEIWINRELMECDVKILTGFIEPHLFAGFSGGGKAIMPGMAGLGTVLGNHSAGMIADQRATWGVTQSNPIWEEIQEVARCAGADFLLNVTLNKYKQITNVFAGEISAAHAAGCAFVAETAMTPVEAPFNIVVTTNSGYPLDLNLYQTIKGISAAAQVVSPGGTILAVAECWDGIPEHGLYGQLLREAGSPQELLERILKPGFLKQDQWQAQIQAQIQLIADVYVYSENLSAEQIRTALLLPSFSLEETLMELVQKYGTDARICVLPEGPQTIPYEIRN